VFGLILSAVVTLMQGYVFWRAASVPVLRRHVGTRRLAMLGLTLWLLFLLGRFTDHSATDSIATLLEFFSMTWLGILFLTTVSLLTADIITGFGCWLKRFVPGMRGLALVAGAVLSVLALIQGLRAPIVQHYDIRLDGLPAALDGTVLVVLSDLHLGALLGQNWLAARVAQVQAEQPDAVILLGDIFEGHAAPDREMMATLARLPAPLGVWSVPGNHESHGGDNMALFEQAGIRVLRNRWTELRPGLILAGVEDLSYDNGSSKTAAALMQALAGRPAGATILLSHAPLRPELIAGRRINLMLSGHTHGGQIWPFGYLVQQRFPLLAGRHDFSGMTAIVSRGTGSWGPRMRLWRPAEILRVTLHASTRASAT